MRCTAHHELLASGEMAPGFDTARLAALLQEFFDHAQRDIKPLGDLFASLLALVIRFDHTFTQTPGRVWPRQHLTYFYLYSI
jgi:hypothetical protein